ncbi:prealbumin-like fold domain-containing protein [Canibacter zhoujuaniae]|uniref:prealbumin-like fold domain-containing protein n=1 Tax=Canibacter zhoujuaniae TaxID=2708343 RepID=UPI00142133FB|nr:SpaA isopeptide-forming pilin-related protein [Canibacter zhoujuaniae]
MPSPNPGLLPLNNRPLKAIVSLLLTLFLAAGFMFATTTAYAAEPDWGIPETQTGLPLNNAAPLTKFDDGQNHVAEVCPVELREILQDRDGNDIKFTTDDGRIVNASWTFCNVRQAYIDAKQAATGRMQAALTSPVYDSFFFINGYSPSRLADLELISMYFRENQQTGEISLGVPYPGTNRFTPQFSGFAPGDTLYRSVNIRVNHMRSAYEEASTALFAFGAGTVKDPNTQTFADAESFSFMTARDLKVDGQPSSLFDTRDSQILVDAQGRETAVWQKVYSRNTDGPEVKRLYQFTLDVPAGQITQIQFRNNFSTRGVTAGTITLREGVHRIPEVEVISVLDKDYRLARGLINAAGEPDVTQPIEPRELAASFTPLDLNQPEDLPDSILAANIIGRTVWAGDTFNARQFDDAFPNFGLAMTENEWLERTTTNAAGYVAVGTDLKQEPVADNPDVLKTSNIEFEYGVNAADGRVQLRKHFYRTFRLIPAQLQAQKTDAETGAALAGAKFELWSHDGSMKLIDKTFTSDENGQITLFDTAGQPLNEVMTDSFIASLPHADDNGIIETERGYLLEPGTYMLREVAAPQGYQLPDSADTLVEISKRDDSTRYEAVTVAVQNVRVPAQNLTPPPNPAEDPVKPVTPISPQEPKPAPHKLAATGAELTPLVVLAGALILSGGALLRRNYRH